MIITNYDEKRLSLKNMIFFIKYVHKNSDHCIFDIIPVVSKKRHASFDIEVTDKLWDFLNGLFCKTFKYGEKECPDLVTENMKNILKKCFNLLTKYGDKYNNNLVYDPEINQYVLKDEITELFNKTMKEISIGIDEFNTELNNRLNGIFSKDFYVAIDYGFGIKKLIPKNTIERLELQNMILVNRIDLLEEKIKEILDEKSKG